MTNPTVTLTRQVSPAPLDWVKVALGGVLLGLVYYAYWVQPAEGAATSYQWLTGHWRNISHYSHGPLIPLIALGLVWWKRPDWHRLRWAPTYWGCAVVAVAMAIYCVGIKSMFPRIPVISFIILLYGLALALGGRDVLRWLFFPISFLFLMVPLNFLEERVGVPLRHLVAQASTFLLNTLGIETTRAGTAIYSSVFKFDVADPCSGIRSLMALTTVTAAYAYVTQSAQWKRWVLFLSAMPLAVLGNMARVTSIALVAQVYGQELATKAYHDWSGYVVFGVALSAMVGIGALLNIRYRHLWQRWNQPPTPIPTESPP